MDFSIYMAGYNTEPMKGAHTVTCNGVGLYVSGLKRGSFTMPDGHPGNFPNQPSLRLYMTNMVSSYEYIEPRENWWVVFKEPSPICYCFSMRGPVWRMGDYILPLPPYILLDAAEIPAMRRVFSEITSKMRSGLPAEHLEAELLISDVLLRFIHTESASSSSSDLGVAEKLKYLIDHDDAWAHSIEEMCDHAGVGRDYARRCFFARFRILPRDYRIQRRVSRIIELLNTTELTIKEIADCCGISNATYLSWLIKNNCGISPKNLRNRYRRIEK